MIIWFVTVITNNFSHHVFVEYIDERCSFSFCRLVCFLPGMGLCGVVQDNKITDTSAADARKGKDIQGIPWERLSISREKYRQTRVEQYKNYENVPQSGEGSEKVEFNA